MEPKTEREHIISIQGHITGVKRDLNNLKDDVAHLHKDVETLGGKIRLNIKSGTQVGHILRVPNKGLKRGNQVGDMMIEVWIDIPKEVNEENKKLIESLNI